MCMRESVKVSKFDAEAALVEFLSYFVIPQFHSQSLRAAHADAKSRHESEGSLERQLPTTITMSSVNKTEESFKKVFYFTQFPATKFRPSVLSTTNCQQKPARPEDHTIFYFQVYRSALKFHEGLEKYTIISLFSRCGDCLQQFTKQPKSS